LVYFVAICYIFPFWYVVRRKIWQPWSCTYYVWPKCVGLRLGRFFHKRIIRSADEAVNKSLRCFFHHSEKINLVFAKEGKNLETKFVQILQSKPGLPDGFFSNQKSKFGQILEVLIYFYGVFDPKQS
jgi:hypothetical protein